MKIVRTFVWEGSILHTFGHVGFSRIKKQNHSLVIYRVIPKHCIHTYKLSLCLPAYNRNESTVQSIDDVAFPWNPGILDPDNKYCANKCPIAVCCRVPVVGGPKYGQNFNPMCASTLCTSVEKSNGQTDACTFASLYKRWILNFEQMQPA